MRPCVTSPRARASGVATVYRHFPQRSDLVAAVYRREVDACVAAASALARELEPGEALVRWLHRYTSFIATKRGLAAAYRSGVPAFEALPAYFRQAPRAGPAIAARRRRRRRSTSATTSRPYELLLAVASLCTAHDGARHSRRMVDLLIDGLRYGAR